MLYHTNLQEHKESVATATEANNVSTWKSVCFACLFAGEFRLVATYRLEVIKYPDHVENVVIFNLDLEHFTHLVSLFEQGLGSEDEHHKK